MNILLSKVRVIDPTSRHHQKVVDIEIKNGRIEQIGRSVSSKFKKIEFPGCMVSPGWLDIGTQIGEPGLEHRETIDSASRAARAGGYTALAPFPNVVPVADNKAQIAYLINRSKTSDVHIYPIGAISKGADGKDMAELIDMQREGAVAFSDGQNGVQNSGLMLRALEYVKPFSGLIIDQSVDKSLAAGAEVHESPLSTSLGLKGQPGLAEALQIRKNIDLVRYAESRLLFHLLSSGEGVEEVKMAKKEGLTVGASVSPFHLCFDEKAIDNFEVNLKFDPPLRSKKDRKNLIKALQKGHIDIIASMHTPLDPEEKVMAFSDATPGAISLPLVYSMLRSHLAEELDATDLVQALCHHPRTWLGIPIPTVQKGEIAELTIFSPEEKWTYTKDHSFSISQNSSFFGTEFTGRVKGTIAKSKVIFE